MKKNKNLKIISWNVNGLRAVEKKDFINTFKTLDADIFCIQESKLQEEQIPKKIKELPDYFAYYSFAKKKGYSGVAVYSKMQALSVKHEMPDKDYHSEGRWLELEFENFILFNIYFPNGQASEERLKYKLGFYDACLKYFKKLKKSGKNLIILGDYNTAHKEIDLARPKANEGTSGFLPIERKWIDKFIASGFVDTFRKFNTNPDEYSWWSYRAGARPRNVGWRIDYVFVNEEFIPKVKNAFILQEIMGSDHCPVGIEVENNVS